MMVVDPLQDPMEHAGGFEGPVVSEDEVQAQHRESVVEADGALARAARAFGPRPIRQRIVERSDESVGARICSFAVEEDAAMIVVGSHRTRERVATSLAISNESAGTGWDSLRRRPPERGMEWARLALDVTGRTHSPKVVGSNPTSATTCARQSRFSGPALSVPGTTSHAIAKCCDASTGKPDVRRPAVPARHIACH